MAESHLTKTKVKLAPSLPKNTLRVQFGHIYRLTLFRYLWTEGLLYAIEVDQIL